MHAHPFTARPLAAAVSLALMTLSTAWAQTTVSPAADADKDGMKFDQIVVTGTSTAKSKMKQSVSVSTLDAEQMEKTGAGSAAELLRSVPGVRSESSGGEGNANITVRGVPLSAGGSRYVQLQEDGLPLVLFGDVSFGTADQFLRADFNVDRLEVIRGGSASTLATNSPGGIVNFISKTGAEAGGSAALTAGLQQRQTRLDVDYGGSLGPRTTFHIGGFQRTGEGVRPAGFTTENGGQIRANITQQLDNGYIRFSVKSLDDRTPTLLPVPVTVSNGQINAINGIDPRTAFFITPSLQNDRSLNHDGGFTNSNTRDGLHIQSNAFGFEGQLKLGEGWTLDEKFRKSSNSGRFIGLFPADNGNNGKNAFFTATLFNSTLDDFGNTFNDIKVSKAFDSGLGKITAVGGVFTGVQTIAQTWFWNQYNMSMTGTNAQVVNAVGAPSSAPVTSGFDTWGGCCSRTWDVQYTHTAPYLALTVDAGALSVDASVRSDQQKASGYTLAASAAMQGWDPASQKKVQYDVQHSSYSVGANYTINRDLSVFARSSDGVSFSADRLLYGNPLDGSVPIALNQIQQQEAGMKWRSGGFSIFSTLFSARTTESNYEATTQKFTANKYSSNGLELEAIWNAGDFRLAGGATWTNAKITDSNDASTVGKKPRRQADFVFQLAPSISLDALELGAALVGTGDSFGDDANTITMAGFTTVNAFTNYRINAKTQVSFRVNNLFNTLGYTEIEGDGHAARAVNGRSASVQLKYTF
ncbi:TonB-dependent receptor [Rhodoferax sp. AJA081-3]|uniref:TonB-dependent receptor n=1 Tax=Rhodoferax sp. AJA081-3 TaxID=2752316 RepID=UPI001ADF7D22|nr:TonB-dependent receptor [Rhodoferax sp. AJA081-3]QTN26651.1 TonB-dependent receptor [Rhodoferax sp. AJA081-3]